MQIPIPSSTGAARLRREQGAAILILLTILVLALSTVLVARLSVNQLKTARVQSNAAVLTLATESLLGYALKQLPPGTLPCPDTTGDGLENTSPGGCQSQRGLLPVRTLNSAVLVDSGDARLWYAVELNLVANAAGSRNPSRSTSLLLDNAPVAAIVIAPGLPLYGQGRTPLLVADFLEGNNADATLNVYSRPPDDTGNDQLLGLDIGNFWSLVSRRVLGDAARLLSEYRTQCGEYPWAATFGGPFASVSSQQLGSLPLAAALPADWGASCGGTPAPPCTPGKGKGKGKGGGGACPGGGAPTGTAPVPATWLSSHWRDQIYYRMCTTAQGSCLTTVGNSNPAASAILLSPGVRLGAQIRPAATVANYFELENIAAPDTQFRDWDSINHSGSYNDVTQLLSP